MLNCEDRTEDRVKSEQKTVLNCGLQRDLSIYGFALLSKAEGLSQFVYPALSLHVKILTARILRICSHLLGKLNPKDLKKGFSLIRRLKEVWRGP